MKRSGWMVCLALGCVSAETSPTHGLLGACVFNDDCQPTLICGARRCRAECRTDRDCTNGWRCRAAGRDDKYVCYDPTDLATGCEYASQCDGHYVCGPGNVCQPQCNDDYDCLIRQPGTTCILYAPEMGVCSDHPDVDGDGGVRDGGRSASRGDGG